ncbi:hypothetical protein OGH69_09525 [Flavobacterium sp. MFBS3-15]|uniref:hypothetical protein n=1 Tax=Flavobacterium sp. MFBS3-15 TaxID=2989816 RepID=UPI0022363F55|nr:hypothetical protein [Flavobacterium sp. MFBS3-15]MCW4469204.1 hypothetical protein [Flavobacterium sp. MFBS3-15]
MNDKKNIDRLFQEKFKDFEITPPEFVWENIEEKLREKKKRRVIPLWIKLSGVAAVLIIGSVLTMPYFNGIDTNKNPVVIEKEGTKRIIPTDNPIPNNGIIIVDSTIINSQNSAVASEEGSDANNDKRHPSEGVEGPTRKSDIPVKRGVRFNAKGEAVAHEGNSGRSNTKGHRNFNGEKRKRIQQNHVQGNGALAYSNGPDNSSTSNNGSNVKSQKAGKQGVRDKIKTDDAFATGNEKDQRGDLSQDPLKTMVEEQGIIERDMPMEQAVAETTVDTSSVLKPENELEKLWKEKTEGKTDGEKAVAEESNKGKWNVKPQVAPLFFNSMSEGSPIDGQFAGNSKNFDNDLSYGVGINYAVTDRLSIRSGINTVNMSYATNDVQFRPSLTGQTSNVSSNARKANIVVQSVNHIAGGSGVELIPNSFSSLSTNEQTFTGSMIQSTGYIEVPVEMSYALVNRKFGIDVIGGMSTLFLNENNVSVISTQGYSAEVGEAQNLNSVHFSTNIGLGFKYRFWKSFQANFEPTFKYQVNTYSRDAGNFKPYFIGLYSGISFSF